MSETLGVAMRVKWALLGEWWCVRADASEEECLAVILRDGAAPVEDAELVRDRLFGGFECKEDPRRRHVYFSSGHYTYLNPTENVPLTEDRRRKVWGELIEANGEPGNGPFTHAGSLRCD